MYLSNRATGPSSVSGRRGGRLPVRILAEAAGGLNRDLVIAAARR
ncbi:hypothetical protein Lokhon_00273 [Limimaricola hongkongensis DSM 17492]|uniref:Uncharacterized protein n=1 Tax=Limimaricola hongkongensis DSM 17492 TaxID=1122180 RepID=A0A017HHT4_9RHOB|nr:hypothetical protein Lokhon_00273 [Limimaricola hongkongensis DSM 17492]